MVRPGVPQIKSFWDKNKCKFCRRCHAEMICPAGAIKILIKKPKTINIIAEKCIGCGKCHLVCPGEAFTMEKRPKPL